MTVGTLVDANVLLDIATGDPRWASWSADALAAVADSGPMFINPIIYAEVSVGFTRIEDVEDALPSTEFRRVAVPYEAAFLAGKAFLKYRQSHGSKRSPLPDFFIGAHAAVADLCLLTRDVGRFGTYFPNVELITPET